MLFGDTRANCAADDFLADEQHNGSSRKPPKPATPNSLLPLTTTFQGLHNVFEEATSNKRSSEQQDCLEISQASPWLDDPSNYSGAYHVPSNEPSVYSTELEGQRMQNQPLNMRSGYATMTSEKGLFLNDASPTLVNFTESGTDELNDLAFHPSTTVRVEMDDHVFNSHMQRVNDVDASLEDAPADTLIVLNPEDSSTKGNTTGPSSVAPLSCNPPEISGYRSAHKWLSTAAVTQGLDPFQFRPPSLPMQTGYYDTADDEDEVLLREHPRRSVEDTATTACGSPRAGVSESASCTSSAFHAQSLPPSSQNSFPLKNEPGFFGTQTANTASAAEARHDTFLDDPYPSGSRANFQPQQPLSNGATRAVYAANSEDEFDEEEELSGLLARTTVRPAAYLQDWKMTNTQRSQNDAVQLNITKERLQGVQRIRCQLSQAAQVFRELAHLINEQQDDLDLLDNSMSSIKHSSANAAEELRKANKRKQQARRRSLFIMGIACLAALVVFFVYVVQSSPSTPIRQATPALVIQDAPQLQELAQFSFDPSSKERSPLNTRNGGIPRGKKAGSVRADV